MRYALFVGAALLLIGAAFVWLRGASAAEEVVEDELDFDADELELELAVDGAPGHAA